MSRMESFFVVVVLVLAVVSLAPVALGHAPVTQQEVFASGEKDKSGLQYNCFRIPALAVGNVCACATMDPLPAAMCSRHVACC